MRQRLYILSVQGLRRETHLFQGNFCLHLCLFIYSPLLNLSACASFPSEVEFCPSKIFFVLSMAMKYLWFKKKLLAQASSPLVILHIICLTMGTFIQRAIPQNKLVWVSTMRIKYPIPDILPF